jgi:p-aminobenzoyl-glutamate transporter AbgT
MCVKACVIVKNNPKNNNFASFLRFSLTNQLVEMMRKPENSAEILSKFKKIGYLLIGVNLAYDITLLCYLAYIRPDIEEIPEDRKYRRRGDMRKLIETPFTTSICIFFICAIFDIGVLYGLAKVSLKNLNLMLKSN